MAVNFAKACQLVPLFPRTMPRFPHIKVNVDRFSGPGEARVELLVPWRVPRQARSEYLHVLRHPQKCNKYASVQPNRSPITSPENIDTLVKGQYIRIRAGMGS